MLVAHLLVTSTLNFDSIKRRINRERFISPLAESIRSIVSFGKDIPIIFSIIYNISKFIIFLESTKFEHKTKEFTEKYDQT